MFISQTCYDNNNSISFAYFSSCCTSLRKYAILESRNIHFDKMSFGDQKNSIRLIPLQDTVLQQLSTVSSSLNIRIFTAFYESLSEQIYFNAQASYLKVPEKIYFVGKVSYISFFFVILTILGGRISERIYFFLLGGKKEKDNTSC